MLDANETKSDMEFDRVMLMPEKVSKSDCELERLPAFMPENVKRSGMELDRVMWTPLLPGGGDVIGWIYFDGLLKNKHIQILPFMHFVKVFLGTSKSVLNWF
nr:hypothetical protein BaRGS_005862 [Batillaria attramentaria]